MSFQDYFVSTMTYTTKWGLKDLVEIHFPAPPRFGFDSRQSSSLLESSVSCYTFSEFRMFLKSENMQSMFLI